MTRWLATCLVFCASLVQAAPQVAIIIDDLGNDYAQAQEVLELPVGVTVALLPRLHNSPRIARQAHRQGREIMLHQPMQSIHQRKLGPGGLTLHHAKTEIEEVVLGNLKSVPHVAGINNHMGSLLTRDPDSMRWLMALLKQRGLFFIDSRTDSGSHAEMIARENGLSTARRDVFIDHEQNPEAIRAQLEKALKLAEKRGSAIAIGHPYPETLAVLKELLPQWQALGIQLVPASKVIAYQRSPESWHASSSPLPRVAKNSKP
jgi:polysaccharide deacetylase 2 family uncharacterized protein YibQ